jgi:O-succinylbenzoate synthase
MKRRTEITIETERVVVLDGVVREDDVQWCEKCGAESRMIAPDAAATLLRVSTQAILRWAEAAGLHFVESADGPPLLCLDSLPRSSPWPTPPT